LENVEVTDDVTACLLCGRYVLQVPGWTMQIRAYDMLRSPWDENHPFLGDGALHFSCLRGSADRDWFRAETLEIYTSYDPSVTIEVEGKPEIMNRISKGYVEQVFSDSSGDLFRHVNTDDWVFIEKKGPLHFFEPEDISVIQRGEVLRQSAGGMTRLPREPDSSLERWSLDQLLDFLGVTDLYQDVLDTLRPEYKFFEYGASNPKFVLTYSLDCDVLLPESLTRFLAGYSYRPRSDDWK
jgi:hypothetical protein